MSTQTWIITGASQGFGRALAEAALSQGDRVVAAVRRPASVADLAEAHRDAIEVVTFDAADTSQAPGLVRVAVDRFGSVDVVVNNAGRGLIGAAEEVGEHELRDLMDLHLHGPASLVRAALPVMRGQGTGTIVQMSSQAGRIAFPGISAYAATEFAIEGWSEALAAEVAPFGIRVVLVEPSRFRTSFNTESSMQFAQESTVYGPVLGTLRTDMTEADGLQEGDPVAAARILVSLAHGDDVPLRLPLGREAVGRLRAAYQHGLDEVARLEDVAVSADFAGHGGPVRSF